MYIHWYSDPLVFLHHSEGWMASLSKSSAACSAAHHVRAASHPSWPSCLQSLHTPFFQTLKRTPPHWAHPGRRACGQGIRLRFPEEPVAWRGNGSFTWRTEQSFSTISEISTRSKCSSLAPAEETELAACTFVLQGMPGEKLETVSTVFWDCDVPDLREEISEISILRHETCYCVTYVLVWQHSCLGWTPPVQLDVETFFCTSWTLKSLTEPCGPVPLSGNKAKCCLWPVLEPWISCCWS